jgi:hypothetical protein
MTKIISKFKARHPKINELTPVSGLKPAYRSVII